MRLSNFLFSMLVILGFSVGAKAQDMTSTPLTFEAVEAGTINIVNPIGLTIEYSKDGTTWTAANSNPISIAVNASDQVRFRGDNPAYGTITSQLQELYTRFTATNDVYVYGNVMSLISSTGFATLTTLERTGGTDEWANDYNLAFLFSTPANADDWAPTNNTTIKNHPTKDIVLPATNVTRSGYMYMFAGCQGLTRAPQLPATDLSTGCYHRMFDGCTSLKKAPVLPAATVPIAGYSCMFNGCSSLSYVKCLATDISADDCTGGWLTGVAAEGIFIKAEGMNDWTVGPQGKWNEVNGIPTGWAVSSETPLTLQAVEAGTINILNPKGLTIEWSKDGTTWTAASSNPISISVAAGDQVRLRGDNACYGNAGGDATHITATNDVYVYGNIMSLVHKDDFATNNVLTSDFAFAEFFCTNDYAETANTTIKSHPTKDLLLPATSLPMGVYMYMFANCQGLERAPELPAMTMSPTCYHRMFGDCTALTAAPKLPATTMADECYFSMFDGCTALTVAPELPATTLANGCYSDMFAHCTALTKAPVLSAPTLANNCYEGMFNGCSSLNYVKCLATDLGTLTTFSGESFYTSTHNWLNGVAATGTFVKAVGMEDWLMETADGIPADWTVKDGTNFNPEATPVTLEATEDATTVTITNPLRLSIGCDKYDSTGNLLASMSSSGKTITIDGLDAGSYVQLSGNSATYSTNGLSTGSTKIDCSADCYVYGNVMSLINSTSYATLKEFTADNALSALFYGNTHLKNHATKELVLPATTLKRGCYRGMFNGNTGLTSAPVLPATTMAPLCYYYMFNGCSNMTTAPELPATELADSCYMTMFQASGLTAAPVLPATTLANGCYYNMFRSCQSLATAPELPATTLAERCYEYMFHSCKALTTAPVLSATTLKPWCYFGMFVNCTGITSAPELPATHMEQSCYLGMFYNSGLTTAPVLPATTLAPTCYKQMFTGCTSLTNVPDLPATTLAESCYEQMFKGCTALVNAPDLAATTLAATCCNYMFEGCTKLEKAPVLPATTLATQCYQRMFDGCTSLVTAPALPATNLADLCYNDMFWECTALKNAPELPATTLADYCYTMMFIGCSSLEKAPELPAAILTPGCYEHMFMNCSKLNYVKCLAVDLGDDSSTDGWMTNVAETGTFVKIPATDWSTKGTTEGTWGDPDSSEGTIPCTFIHGIPTGWTVETTEAIPTTDVAANADGEGNYWATFYNAAAGFTADANATVYTAKISDDKTKVELKKVTNKTIPTDNAVILKSSNAKVTMTYNATATGTLADNDLQGSATAIETPASTYMLVKGDSGVGFYHWTTATIPARRAYLIIPAASRSFLSISEGEATAIDAIMDTAGDDPLYDLTGRKANGKPQRGIYVRNGKKIIIK